MSDFEEMNRLYNNVLKSNTCQYKDDLEEEEEEEFEEEIEEEFVHNNSVSNDSDFKKMNDFYKKSILKESPLRRVSVNSLINNRKKFKFL